MSLSTRPRLAQSRSSLSMRRIPSLLARIFSDSSLEVPQREERRRRQSQHLKSLLPASSQHLQILNHQRRNQNPSKKKQVHLHHKKSRKRNQSQRRTRHPQNRPNPSQTPSRAALAQRWVTERNVEYVELSFQLLSAVANIPPRLR